MDVHPYTHSYVDTYIVPVTGSGSPPPPSTPKVVVHHELVCERVA